jgi:cell division protein FtsW (lipid II flippase)
MAHFAQQIASHWVIGLAVLGFAFAVGLLIWHSGYEQRRFAAWCSTLHVHPDMIHSHDDGVHAHVHLATGERVTVSS